ncbi:hypothetical protein ES705_38260 [subsurface metagenome]
MIYRKVEEGQLSLDCSLKTYLYSVCRILWLKELETRKLIRNNDPELKNIVDPEVNFYLENGDLEKKKLIQEHLMHLKENCRQILTLFYAGVPIDEITEILGMSSTANTRQKKNRCKKILIKSIKKDPRFRNSGISE